MKKNNFKRIVFRKERKGFTIIESLFAILILLLSITGPMYFSHSGLKASFVSRDQVTAFYLAQDAIEFIKNWRDLNVLTGTSNWHSGFSSCINNSCSLDTFIGSYPYSTFINDGILLCTSSNVPGCFDGVPLKINTNGFLGHAGTQNSIFYREIKMNVIRSINEGGVDVPAEIEVVVKVKWTTREIIGEREIIVKEHIFNWNTLN